MGPDFNDVVRRGLGYEAAKDDVADALARLQSGVHCATLQSDWDHAR
jgi:hypothetical protein